MIKLTKLLKEDKKKLIEATNEEPWVLYYTKGLFTKEKIKEFKSKRAAAIAMNKLIKSDQFEDYFSGVGISTKEAFKK
jgi:hypothetical protein